MKSGGESVIRFNPSQATDGGVTGSAADGTLNEAELREGLRNERGEKVTEIDPNMRVRFGDKIVRWKDIIEAFSGQTVTSGGTAEAVASAQHLSPDEVLKRSKNVAYDDALKTFQEIKDLRKLSADGTAYPKTFGGLTFSTKAELEDAIQKRVAQLAQLNQQMRQANAARGLGENDGIQREWLRETGMESESNGDHSNSGGGGGFSVSVPAQTFGGGTTSGATAPAQTTGGTGGTGGGGGVPASTFDGLTPPTSPAYAAALYLDSNISEGLGGALKNSTEGKKLMMLFLFLSRMAEEGSVEWMRMLVKLVGHIMAKSGAKNTVAMTGQIIKNLEVQNKATELIVNTPAGDTPEKMAEFNKALQQARSMESMANTNIQLLGNMLQEFGNGVEAGVNMYKFYVDLQGRIDRRATSQA